MSDPRVTADSSPVQEPLRLEVAELIVATLNLEVTAAQIDPAAPLYGEGLGLDSIDILEIALVAAKHYGIELLADNEENQVIFASLDHLVGYIAAHRTR